MIGFGQFRLCLPEYARFERPSLPGRYRREGDQKEGSTEGRQVIRPGAGFFGIFPGCGPSGLSGHSRNQPQGSVSQNRKRFLKNPGKFSEKFQKKLLWRNHFDSNYDALLGSAPAAMVSPGCDCAVLSVCNRREIFSSGNAGASQCAPPQGGPGWCKGGRSSSEKRISPEQKN
jgi:hypothetical protein